MIKIQKKAPTLKVNQAYKTLTEVRKRLMCTQKQMKWNHMEVSQEHSQKSRNSSEEGKGSTQLHHTLHEPEVGNCGSP